MLVYKSTTDLGMLILYPDALLTLLIGSNSLLVEKTPLGFSIYEIMYSAETLHDEHLREVGSSVLQMRLKC